MENKPAIPWFAAILFLWTVFVVIIYVTGYISNVEPTYQKYGPTKPDFTGLAILFFGGYFVIYSLRAMLNWLRNRNNISDEP
jgi:hypothetical protein